MYCHISRVSKVTFFWDRTGNPNVTLFQLGFFGSFPSHKVFCKMEVITHLITVSKICIFGETGFFSCHAIAIIAILSAVNLHFQLSFKHSARGWFNRRFYNYLSNWQGRIIFLLLFQQQGRLPYRGWVRTDNLQNRFFLHFGAIRRKQNKSQEWKNWKRQMVTDYNNIQDHSNCLKFMLEFFFTSQGKMSCLFCALVDRFNAFMLDLGFGYVSLVLQGVLESLHRVCQCFFSN